MISKVRFKIIIVGYLLFFVTSMGFSQTKKMSDPEGTFVAVIVKDIDASISWYQDVLDFELVNRADLPERGIKQSNLRRGRIDIELIELSTAISQESALAKSPDASRIQGFFKIGFQVSDFDEWVLYLTNAKVEFGGSVVTDRETGKRMLIVKDPDGNRIQFFEK